jgi:E3 ubiquitin-protein ligase SIAH1
MASRQIDLKLLEELKCPVCVEYMEHPINMCENGHNICRNCKERLTECPTCRGNFTNVRNIALEKFAACAIFPCKNVKVGCKETVTVNDRDNHLAVCLFESRECPFRKLFGDDCTWTGTGEDLSFHILFKHERNTVKVPAHFRVELPDFGVGGRYRIAVMYMMELFYLTWDTEGDMFRFGVFHFCLKPESNMYQYGIKIGNCDTYFTATRKCHNYWEGGLNDIQPSNCVTIDFDAIPKPTGEQEKYSCVIEIGKCNLNKFVSEDIVEHIAVFPAIRNS